MTLTERWAAFSPRERYLLMGAVGTAVVVTLYYSPLARIGDLSSAGSEDDRWVQVQKIENYQKILGRREAAWVRGKALLARFDKNQQRLIEGTTPTQVGAALQGRLSQMSGDAGLNVLSSQILKQDEIDGFNRVGVRLTLSGGLEGVTRLLSSIETGSTDLVVTHLEINRKLGASRRPPSRATQPQTPVSPLTATMEVKTFMRSSEP